MSKFTDREIEDYLREQWAKINPQEIVTAKDIKNFRMGLDYGKN